MEGTSGIEAMLPLLLIQLVMMGLFWKVAMRLGINKILYIVVIITPLIGYFFPLYLFGRGIVTILDKLDELKATNES